MQRFEPEYPAGVTDVNTLLEFVMREHGRIAAAFAGTLPSELTEFNVEPSKKREFMVVAADGTNWNPGSGRGVYVYYSSAWHFLG